MKYYINVNKALAIGALAVAGIAAAWYFVKESKKIDSLNEYKEKKLDGVDEVINKASIDNDKLESFQDRAIAKEVLYSLKDRVRNASTESDVDAKFNELINEAQSFVVNDSVSVKASIIFHKSRMDARKAEDEKVQEHTFEKEKIVEGGKVAASLIRAVGTYL